MDTTPQVAPAVPAASAPASEPVDTQRPDTPTPDAPQQDPAQEERRRKSAADRIDQLTARYREEQRAREAVEAKLAAFERQQQIAKTFADIDAQQPRIDQFSDLHSYTLAMSEWNRTRTLAEAERKWEEREQARAAREAQETAKFFEQQQRVAAENAVLNTKMATGSKLYPDFEQAITNPALPSVRGTPLFQAVLQADNAPHIAYALAKNPPELERLLSIRDPIALSREVFRLDQKFTGNGVTQAPPPPPQRNGSGTVSKDWTDMSTAEHVKAYREAKRKRR